VDPGVCKRMNGGPSGVAGITAAGWIALAILPLVVVVLYICVSAFIQFLQEKLGL
jgi:hypothetical protein